MIKRKFPLPNAVLSEYFKIDNIIDVYPYGNGHINNTFVVIFPTCKYIIQKINDEVFTNPFAVMNNIELVTAHIRKNVIYNGQDARTSVLTTVLTKYGQTMAIVNDEYWRCTRFIEEGITYDQTDEPEIFEEAGRAVGLFHRHLDNFQARLLIDTIKHFHNTPYRYNTFLDTLKIDRVDRVKKCQEEIEFVNDRKDKIGIITKLLHERKIPKRVTHNDTKLNNIMIDKSTKKALAMIDLDTVMKGSLLYDYGDALRCGASTKEEDSTELEDVTVNVEFFKAFTRGYLKEVKGIIVDEEIKHLVYSFFLMCFEVGMRFLTDYIDGDRYFRLNTEQKQKRPNINLERARNQLKLASEVEKRFDELTDVVNDVLNELGYRIILEKGIIL